MSSDIAREAEILRLRDEVWRIEAANAERRRIRDSQADTPAIRGMINSMPHPVRIAASWTMHLRDRLLVGVCAAWIQSTLDISGA